MIPILLVTEAQGLRNSPAIKELGGRSGESRTENDRPISNLFQTDFERMDKNRDVPEIPNRSNWVWWWKKHSGQRGQEGHTCPGEVSSELTEVGHVGQRQSLQPCNYANSVTLNLSQVRHGRMKDTARGNLFYTLSKNKLNTKHT